MNHCIVKRAKTAYFFLFQIKNALTRYFSLFEWPQKTLKIVRENKLYFQLNPNLLCFFLIFRACLDWMDWKEKKEIWGWGNDTFCIIFSSEATLWLQMSACLFVRPTLRLERLGGNVIFSTPIQDKYLRSLMKIPISLYSIIISSVFLSVITPIIIDVTVLG